MTTIDLATITAARPVLRDGGGRYSLSWYTAEDHDGADLRADIYELGGQIVDTRPLTGWGPWAHAIDVRWPDGVQMPGTYFVEGGR